MQDILAQFLSLGTVVFCLLVFALVWVQRKGAELIFPKLLTSKPWNEFFVPLGPLGTGAIIASLFSKYPYPTMFMNSVWYDRAAYGIACGLVSGLVYKIVWKGLMEKTGKTPDEQPKDQPNDPFQS